MMVRNYNKEMKAELASFSERNKPSLFLHACCAPCACHPLDLLNKYFDICVFYYNPNITDEAEYDLRYHELERYLADKYPHIALIDGGKEYDKFLTITNGLENVPEGGARCAKCFTLRLEETAKRAKLEGYEYFATTLTLSPMKNPTLINGIGEQMAEKYGLKYLVSDFKKDGGVAESSRISKEENFYRQNYCGCAYSKRQ